MYKSFMYCTAGNFHQEKIYANFAAPTLSLAKLLVFSCVNDYIDKMATFTTLAKIYFMKYFCYIHVQRKLGLVKIFFSETFQLFDIYKAGVPIMDLYTSVASS